ncbi:hypothetical protein MT418_003032 [Batrachochytrium dendrobatidis]
MVCSIIAASIQESVLRACQNCSRPTQIPNDVLFMAKFFCCHCHKHTDLVKKYKLKVKIATPSGELVYTTLHNEMAENLLGVTAYRYDQIAFQHPSIHAFVEQQLSTILVSIKWKSEKLPDSTVSAQTWKNNYKLPDFFNPVLDYAPVVPYFCLFYNIPIISTQ